MISEHDIAQLCLDIYQGQPAQWDQLEVPPDGVAFGIKEYPEGIALIFRGSATLQDWLRNAEAIADPSAHQELGPVHPGFFAGLPELWTRLPAAIDAKALYRRRPQPRRRARFAVHRVDGARRQAAGATTVLWRAPPRLPAGRRHHRKCAGTRSYRRNANGRAHDLVTDVPFTSWIEDYVNIRRRLFRSARRRATPMCSAATFFSPGTRCGFMHRQRRTFRSSDRARRA